MGLLLLMQHLQGGAAPQQEEEGSSPGPNKRKAPEPEQDNISERPVEQQLLEAERCIQQNNYDRAESLAEKATKADPESAKAWEILTTAQKWLGRREEALATVRKAQDLYEVQSAGLTALQKELEQSKSPADIAAECEAKGEEFMSGRMYDLAVSNYTQAIEALEATELAEADRPLHLRLLRRRAECAQQLQDWGMCRRDASTVLEQFPDDEKALLQRAASNEALEKFKAALEDARKLLAIDPKSKAANRIAHNCQQALRD